MTPQQEAAMRQALKALEHTESRVHTIAWMREQQAITALRQALEQQPADEPVAWPTTASEVSDFIGSSYVWREHKISDVEPHDDDKYCVTAHDLIEAFEAWADTRPQPAAWVGLTDEEIHAISKATHFQSKPVTAFARAIEAKLKEKNGHG